MIEFVRQEVPNKSIWLWTSYTIEQIIWQNIIPRSVIEKIDVIVDGKFILAERDISLKFRGSKNQRVIDVKKYLKNEKKHLESLEFTNQHIKILLRISFGMS